MIRKALLVALLAVFAVAAFAQPPTAITEPPADRSTGTLEWTVTVASGGWANGTYMPLVGTVRYIRCITTSSDVRLNGRQTIRSANGSVVGVQIKPWGMSGLYPAATDTVWTVRPSTTTPWHEIVAGVDILYVWNVGVSNADVTFQAILD